MLNLKSFITKPFILLIGSITIAGVKYPRLKSPV